MTDNQETELSIMTQRDRLRIALTGLVGADTVEELETMHKHVLSMPIPQADKTAMLYAVQVLLDILRG